MATQGERTKQPTKTKISLNKITRIWRKYDPIN